MKSELFKFVLNSAKLQKPKTIKNSTIFKAQYRTLKTARTAKPTSDENH